MQFDFIENICKFVFKNVLKEKNKDYGFGFGISVW